MRYLLFLLSFSLQAIFSFAQPDIDVQSYEFGIFLSDSNDVIRGQTVVEIKFLKSVSSFFIDLATQNEAGRGMKVTTIFTDDMKKLNFVAGNDKLKIILPKETTANETKRFIISYFGIPKDGLIISKNKYGDRTFFADNWPDRAHQWLPCVDDPADKARFDFTIVAPSGYKVISNGMIIDDNDVGPPIALPGFTRTSWKERVELPTKVIVIGVAKFAVKTYADSPKNIPITAWIFPQDTTKGFKNYSYAPEILKFYSSYVGPYPYEKLANVQSKTIFGGMENASCIFYFEGSASSNSSVEDLLAHEIAHQWFGDMVTEKKYSHLWLSEGFASYFTDLYFEAKYGRDSANYRLKKERSDVIGFTNGQPIVDTVSKGMGLLNANSYQKGAWVLHMLRSQVGDSAFHLIIKKYYDAYKGKNADTEDLQKIVEEVTKKDFNQFFKQWLYTPGIPQLKIKWNNDKKHVSITIDQDQKQDFQFPLQILMQFSNGKTQIATVNIKNRHEVFDLSAKETVSNIQLDPNTSLLFDGKIQKIK